MVYVKGLEASHSRFKLSQMKTKILKSIAFISLSSTPLLQVVAQQPIGIALSAGTGSDADIYGVTVVSNIGFWEHTSESKSFRIVGHLETSLSNIDGRMTDGNKGIVVAGLTPVFRLKPASSRLYIEAGIGATYFSEKKIHRDKAVGTHFEFGDILGFGVTFGQNDAHELGYRVVHYSNAGMSQNNPGIDFHQLRVKFGF